MSGEKLPYHLQDYCVLDMLDEGVFGQVLHCLKPTSAETVAVKVLKKEGQYSLKRELAMLHRVQQLDPEKCHVVKFIDTFVWNDNTCMVFEMLDCSLIDFCKRRKKRPNLSEIRVIAQQLLMAFEALGELGIVHTDLKPDNVMLINCKNQPLKVKLIDFGVAHLKSEMKLGSSHQNIYYQAPEVSLGLPLTEALDMWSLGVVLVVLYLGKLPFSGSSPYNKLRTISCVVGAPSDELLDRGIYTNRYYSKKENGWTFKTPEEYYKDTRMAPIDTAGQLQGSNLDEAIRSYPPEITFPEFRDRMGFLNLLRKLLHVGFSKRITPSEALQHEFITLEYFEENHDEYVKQARVLMGLVQRNTSRDPQNPTPEKVPQEVKEMPPTSRECSSLYTRYISREYECMEVEEDGKIFNKPPPITKQTGQPKEVQEEDHPEEVQEEKDHPENCWTEIDHRIEGISPENAEEFESQTRDSSPPRCILEVLEIENGAREAQSNLPEGPDDPKSQTEIVSLPWNSPEEVVNDIDEEQESPNLRHRSSVQRILSAARTFWRNVAVSTRKWYSRSRMRTIFRRENRSSASRGH